MLLPPPGCTLFPYTTLFRSQQVLRRFLHDLAGIAPGWTISSIIEDTVLAIWEQIGSTVSSMIDRKSTRLNSSHMSISYAVFCLKKKPVLLNYSFPHIVIIGL